MTGAGSSGSEMTRPEIGRSAAPMSSGAEAGDPGPGLGDAPGIWFRRSRSCSGAFSTSTQKSAIRHWER